MQPAPAHQSITDKAIARRAFVPVMELGLTGEKSNAMSVGLSSRFPGSGADFLHVRRLILLSILGIFNSHNLAGPSVLGQQVQCVA